MALRECPVCGCAFKAPRRRPPAIVTDNGVTYALYRSRLLQNSRILHECSPEPPGRAGGDEAGQPAKPKTPRPSGYSREALDLPIAN
jgi:hypothetical protein